MKITIDTEKKTIKLYESVNLEDLYVFIDESFSNPQEWEIEMGTVDLRKIVINPNKNEPFQPMIAPLDTHTWPGVNPLRPNIVYTTSK